MLITKFGPRVPLVGGMVATATAMFGMSTLSPGSGTFGTAVLGAVMSAKVSADLAGNWQDAVLELPLDPSLEQAAEIGVAPPQPAEAPGVTPDIFAKITGVMRDTFVSMMSLAFLVAGAVAVVAASVATRTKRGDNADAAGAGVHI